MTRDEFCDFLKTAKKGSRIKRIETDIFFAFDGLYFNSPFPVEKLLIDVVFVNPELYEIVKTPQKKEYALILSNMGSDGIFTSTDDSLLLNYLSGIIKCSPYDGDDSIKIRITIEEVFK